MESCASRVGHPPALIMRGKPTRFHQATSSSHRKAAWRQCLSVISRNPWDQALIATPIWCHVLSYEPLNIHSQHAEASVITRDPPGIASALDRRTSYDSRRHEQESPEPRQGSSSFLSDSPQQKHGRHGLRSFASHSSGVSGEK